MKNKNDLLQKSCSECTRRTDSLHVVKRKYIRSNENSETLSLENTSRSVFDEANAIGDKVERNNINSTSAITVTQSRINAVGKNQKGNYF
ncbi:hypothetical protein DPMN_143825 [Dreissena polymorpha]|uniref:Uncharacterized protein n=1 Tax=Dreissena polymorpha TaxID=45954 RepID=A0A9D4GEG4_DREPO|nr:hypothetical protein DPMN_143825 [Dreissena polymorpha]